LLQLIHFSAHPLQFTRQVMLVQRRVALVQALPGSFVVARAQLFNQVQRLFEIANGFFNEFLIVGDARIIAGIEDVLAVGLFEFEEQGVPFDRVLA
jgi:hypothetical protein